MTMACRVSLSLFREKRNGDEFDKALAEVYARNYIFNIKNRYQLTEIGDIYKLDSDEYSALVEVLEYLAE